MPPVPHKCNLEAKELGIKWRSAHRSLVREDANSIPYNLLVLVSPMKATLLASACLAFFSLAAHGQSIDNKGTEFMLGFLENNESGSIAQPEVHLSAEADTDVRVRYPIDGSILDTTVTVAAGTIQIVTLPEAASDAWNVDSPGQANAVLVESQSSEEIVCYMVNRAPFTSDCAMSLPVDALNTEYIVMDHPGNNGQGGSEFVVVAPFDGTVVTVTTSVPFGSIPAGGSFNFTLNRGGGYFARLGTDGALFNGTTISATRPVFVANGNVCANVPVGTGFCDHVFEVAHPVQTWGTEFIGVNLPNRPGGSVYGFLASEDGTTINADGAFFTTLNRGEFIYTTPTNIFFSIESNRPIFMTEYMTGSQSPGAILGDPAMGNVIPTAQFQDSYTFSTAGGSQFVQNFVTVTVLTTDLGSLTLDGAAVNPGDFTAVSTSGYSAANLTLSEGTHNMDCDSPFGIAVSGYNGDDSYLYPGGALFQAINPVGDANPPICNLGLSKDGNFGAGLAQDNRPSEDTNGNGFLEPGEDLNGNGQIDTDSGIFSITLDPSSTNVSLDVDPFVPGDGVVAFTVNLDPGALSGSALVVVTDGSGNSTTCPLDLFCQGSVSYSGVGLAGTGGAVPTIESSCPQVAAMTSVTIESSSPDSMGYLTYGQVPVSVPFLGGTVYVAPEQLFIFMTDPGGTHKMSFMAPSNPMLAGETYLWQAAIMDAGAPFGLSFTNRMDTLFAL